mmetsp:Transcript_23289/g.59534  ORF Transcript_23289/g.59534 Transcript_23289/m.59534 type:complete len:80 (+) Transcript_23289:81-320(+)
MLHAVVEVLEWEQDEFEPEQQAAGPDAGCRASHPLGQVGGDVWAVGCGDCLCCCKRTACWVVERCWWNGSTRVWGLVEQ